MCTLSTRQCRTADLYWLAIALRSIGLTQGHLVHAVQAMHVPLASRLSNKLTTGGFESSSS